MATIRDVAKASGVSTATVSAVINDSAYVSPELRTRVLTAIRDLGYAPSTTARNLRSGRSQLIGLVVADLANPFFSRVVWAAEAAVAAVPGAEVPAGEAAPAAPAAAPEAEAREEGKDKEKGKGKGKE